MQSMAERTSKDPLINTQTVGPAKAKANRIAAFEQFLQDGGAVLQGTIVPDNKQRIERRVVPGKLKSRQSAAAITNLLLGLDTGPVSGIAIDDRRPFDANDGRWRLRRHYRGSHRRKTGSQYREHNENRKRFVHRNLEPQQPHLQVLPGNLLGSRCDGADAAIIIGTGLTEELRDTPIRPQPRLPPSSRNT